MVVQCGNYGLQSNSLSVWRVCPYYLEYLVDKTKEVIERLICLVTRYQLSVAREHLHKFCFNQGCVER